MVKYQFINLESLNKKPGKYENLKENLESALQLLKLDDLSNPSPHTRLLPNTQCMSCKTDLAGKVVRVAIKPPKKAWFGDARTTSEPFILEYVREAIKLDTLNC